MDKKLDGFLHIAFAIAVVVVVLIFSRDLWALKRFGYWGAFVISLLSSATILIPMPSWVVIAAMGRYLNPYMLGLVAGVGSAIGEMTGYSAGEGAMELLEGRVKETKDIHRFVDKYGVLAIFAFAFIPNPLFDIAGIAAGAGKIPWWQFLFACAAGRILRYMLLAMIGNFSLGLIS